MFPPNNPHHPRNRSCTRCLNGTKRKGVYAVFAIGVFLCIIFAVTLMYEHHVLDVSKQHVVGTMHQSYNAESPKFVNESRRREPAAGTARPELKGFAAIQYNQEGHWTLTIANPPDGCSKHFTDTIMSMKPDQVKRETVGKSPNGAKEWLESKMSQGIIDMDISIEYLYMTAKSAQSQEWLRRFNSNETIGIKAVWTQSPLARANVLAQKIMERLEKQCDLHGRGDAFRAWKIEEGKNIGKIIQENNWSDAEAETSLTYEAMSQELDRRERE